MDEEKKMPPVVKCRSVLMATVLAACVLCAAGAMAQSLDADYRFQNSLVSSVGKAPALANLGENSFGVEAVNGQQRSVLRFPEGSGVVLNGARGVFDGKTYSIIMQFRLETTQGWRRLIDFKNATSDLGLYTKEGALQFYDLATGAGVMVHPNEWVQVILTRDKQRNVSGYVNGRLQFTFVDTKDDGVIGDANTLRFFRDDGTEHSAGAVARIRIYDGPLTVVEAPPSRLYCGTETGTGIRKVHYLTVGRESASDREQNRKTKAGPQWSGDHHGGFWRMGCGRTLESGMGATERYGLHRCDTPVHRARLQLD